MIKFAINSAKYTLAKMGLGVTRYDTLENLRKNAYAMRDITFLQRLNGQNAEKLIHYFAKSRSQLRQDLFALSHLGFKRNGYFVEFGATNGCDLSNTWLMEKEFRWTGILAEPAKCWHRELHANRNCNIHTGCVWKESNAKLWFNEAEIADLSTIDAYSDADLHSSVRKSVRRYEVETISLIDLLRTYKAPRFIDYLSIDTEGSEYDILSRFDFSQYSFGIITCEHNFTGRRDNIHSLLSHHGYRRVCEDISMVDDWYVNRSLDMFLRHSVEAEMKPARHLATASLNGEGSSRPNGKRSGYPPY